MCSASKEISVVAWEVHCASGYNLLRESYTTFSFSLYVPSLFCQLKSASKMESVHPVGNMSVRTIPYTALTISVRRLSITFQCAFRPALHTSGCAMVFSSRKNRSSRIHRVFLIDNGDRVLCVVSYTEQFAHVCLALLLSEYY